MVGNMLDSGGTIACMEMAITSGLTVDHIKVY